MTYIQSVKMMINAAAIMLGLTKASVRINGDLTSISEHDVWAKYKFLDIGGTMYDTFEHLDGETNNYVSFMVEPKGVTETYQNQVGQSQIYSSVLESGTGIGNEIAFLTSSSQNQVDDIVVNLAGGAINAAERLMTALTGGIGRFTAAVASGMARGFTGDHTIYPDIFQKHQSNAPAMAFTVKLRASGGDPYSYFTEILVPMFFALGMALPKMSKHSSAAYQYPPLVQCNVPGLWGTRLGIVESLNIVKNVSGTDISAHGFPLSVDLTINVRDLQHVMVSSPMNKPSVFLNNNTMFDYIAQMCGVDKYKPNGSMRLMTKALLAESQNFLRDLGEAAMEDYYGGMNRFVYGRGN